MKNKQEETKMKKNEKTTNNDTMQLKSEAYDILVQIEMRQFEIQKLQEDLKNKNQEISNSINKLKTN